MWFFFRVIFKFFKDFRIAVEEQLNIMAISCKYASGLALTYSINFSESTFLNERLTGCFFKFFSYKTDSVTGQLLYT